MLDLFDKWVSPVLNPAYGGVLTSNVSVKGLLIPVINEIKRYFFLFIEAS